MHVNSYSAPQYYVEYIAGVAGKVGFNFIQVETGKTGPLQFNLTPTACSSAHQPPPAASNFYLNFNQLSSYQCRTVSSPSLALCGESDVNGVLEIGSRAASGPLAHRSLKPQQVHRIAARFD